MERLERIDQHLVELNEALVLLLALDDLIREREPESRPSSTGDQLTEWQKLLEQHRAALEGTRQRLETVADRLVSISSEIAAVSSELRTLVQKSRGTSPGSDQKSQIVPITFGRVAAPGKAASAAASPAPTVSGRPARPGQGPARARPAAAEASGPAGGSPPEGRADSRRRRWFW